MKRAIRGILFTAMLLVGILGATFGMYVYLSSSPPPSGGGVALHEVLFVVALASGAGAIFVALFHFRKTRKGRGG